MTDTGAARPDRRPKGRSGRETARIVVAVVAGGLIAAFAVLNTNQVEVNWIFGSFETPLIIVILVCLALGLLIGLTGRRPRRRAGGDRAG